MIAMKQIKTNALMRDMFIQLLFVMIYFGSSIVLLGSVYRPIDSSLIMLRYILVGLGFICLIIMYIFKRKYIGIRFPTYISFYLFFSWISFSLSVIVSEISHSTFPLQGLFFFIMIPLVYFIVMPGVSPKREKNVFWGIFIANALYLAWSFVNVPVQYLPYSGIAANTNGFGQICTLTFISALYFFLAEGIRPGTKGFTIKLVCFLSLPVSFIGILLTSSRTSFVVAIIMAFTILVYFAIFKGQKKPLILLVVGFVVVVLSPLKNILFSGILEKALGLYNQGDNLNGRSEVWERIINEATVFGNGETYFEGVMEGAHNSIIYILAVYGYLSALLLSLFLIFAIIESIRYAVVNRANSHYALLPFVIIFTFFLYSMTESMFGLIGNGLTIAFYNVVGFLFIKGRSIGDINYGSKKAF